MWVFLAVLLAVFWAITGFHLWRLSRPGRQLRLVHKTAQSLDLGLDQRTGPQVQARLVRRERVALVGMAVLLTAYLPVAVVLDDHHAGRPHPESPVVFALPFVIILASRPLLLSLLMAFEALQRRRTAGPRVARVVVPRLTDYIRPVEVWAARGLACVVVPASALIVSLAQTRREDEPWLSAAALLATALSAPALLAIVELSARRLVELAQPASTPIELAWDDALRSIQLRELYLVVTGFSLMISVFTLSDLDTPFIAIYGVLLILLLLGFAGSPASHFRRRLWPVPSQRGNA